METKVRLPKVPFTGVRKLIWLALFASLIFSLGYFAGAGGFRLARKDGGLVKISREIPESKKNLDFSLFWRVWDTVYADYYDKTKLIPSELVYGAISGMVSAIGDPYTAFLPPAENKVINEDLSGSFEGVGIQIGYKGTQLAVIAPLPGSPAEKAGIKAGDFIVGIKDTVKKIDRGTIGISLPEAVEAIRGKAGTKVTLVLLRDGGKEPIITELARVKLDVPSIILSYEGENKEVAVIKILKFGAETKKEWEKAVREITAKSVSKVVVDLRNNPGGYLEGAVDAASEFLKPGTVVTIEDKGNDQKNEYKVKRAGKLLNAEVVVLINGGSASASEIFAGALRDILSIRLIGETSFGKGTIQEPLDLEGGSGLHITIAKWLTPKGTWVNEKGLDPDVKIEDDEKTSGDEQLQEAVRLINQ